MKTPDTIKLALNLCWKTRWEIGFAVCNDCPYISAVKPTCKEALEMDVREYIYQLEAERDAAIADLTEMTDHLGDTACHWCDKTDCELGCMEADNNEGFKWRGVQKEE